MEKWWKRVRWVHFYFIINSLHVPGQERNWKFKLSLRTNVRQPNQNNHSVFWYCCSLVSWQLKRLDIEIITSRNISGVPSYTWEPCWAWTGWQGWSLLDESFDRGCYPLWSCLRDWSLHQALRHWCPWSGQSPHKPTRGGFSQLLWDLIIWFLETFLV